MSGKEKKLYLVHATPIKLLPRILADGYLRPVSETKIFEGLGAWDMYENETSENVFFRHSDDTYISNEGSYFCYLYFDSDLLLGKDIFICDTDVPDPDVKKGCVEYKNVGDVKGILSKHDEDEQITFKGNVDLGKWLVYIDFADNPIMASNVVTINYSISLIKPCPGINLSRKDLLKYVETLEESSFERFYKELSLGYYADQELGRILDEKYPNIIFYGKLRDSEKVTIIDPELYLRFKSCDFEDLLRKNKKKLKKNVFMLPLDKTNLWRNDSKLDVCMLFDIKTLGSGGSLINLKSEKEKMIEVYDWYISEDFETYYPTDKNLAFFEQKYNEYDREFTIKGAELKWLKEVTYFNYNKSLLDLMVLQREKLPGTDINILFSLTVKNIKEIENEGFKVKKLKKDVYILE
jgi:hypothetical protein